MTVASQVNLTQRQSWKALATHFDEIGDVHLRTLFADDPKRGARLTDSTLSTLRAWFPEMET